MSQIVYLVPSFIIYQRTGDFECIPHTIFYISLNQGYRSLKGQFYRDKIGISQNGFVYCLFYF